MCVRLSRWRCCIPACLTLPAVLARRFTKFTDLHVQDTAALDGLRVQLQQREASLRSTQLALKKARQSAQEAQTAQTHQARNHALSLSELRQELQQAQDALATRERCMQKAAAEQTHACGAAASSAAACSHASPHMVSCRPWTYLLLKYLRLDRCVLVATCQSNCSIGSAACMRQCTLHHTMKGHDSTSAFPAVDVSVFRATWDCSSHVRSCPGRFTELSGLSGQLLHGMGTCAL